MTISDAGGPRPINRAAWEALTEQRARVLNQSAQVRDEARQAQSEAVERRLCSEAERLERNATRTLNVTLTGAATA